MTMLHEGMPVLTAGEPLASARAAMIMVHGRGATAQDILTLTPELAEPGWCFLAPQARGAQWYPARFMEPVERNEPWLSSALGVVGGMLTGVAAAGIPAERTVLLGFSQGACLASEYSARNARRYGGLIVLSGGLIGADGVERHDEGSLSGTPVFMGCDELDPHIPRYRVEETSRVLEALGAEVTLEIYNDLGHSVNEDELAHARAIMRRVTGE